MNINKEQFIARGGGRNCYSHPSDPSKVIKIPHKDRRDQNELEFRYFNHLAKQNISYKHIARCYDYIQTNLGRGLVCEKVANYDGSTSLTLKEAVNSSLFTPSKIADLIHELKEYLYKNSVLFVDLGLENILCCEYKKGEYRLIIVDGLGGRRINFRFWLYLHSALYTKYKVIKQWQKFEREHLKNIL